MEEARTMLRWQTIALFLYCIPPAIPKSLADIAPAFFLTRSKNMLERISENASSDEEFWENKLKVFVSAQTTDRQETNFSVCTNNSPFLPSQHIWSNLKFQSNKNQNISVPVQYWLLLEEGPLWKILLSILASKLMIFHECGAYITNSHTTFALLWVWSCLRCVTTLYLFILN